MPPDSIQRLVEAARRRITAMRLARRIVVALALVGVASALVLGVARIVVMPWAEPAAVIFAGIVLVGVALWTLLRKPSDRFAAIELDRRLETKDQVATALELAGSDDDNALAVAQVERTGSWAEGRNLTGFGPIWPERGLLALAAVAVLAAVSLAVPSSPADAEQRRREAVAEVVDDVADDLEEAADELGTDDVADELRRIAEELRQAEDLDAAMEQLGDARNRLTDGDDSDALSLKTALEGANAHLDQQPLAEGSGLQEQLQNLASALDGMDAASRAEAAGRLADLAAQLGPTSPELADALTEAAEAVESGDGADALQDATHAAGEASDRVAASGDRAAARSAVRDAQGNLAGRSGDNPGEPGDGPGEPGDGNGQGQGQGDGEGDGDGDGQGSGSGQGQGQGQGGGGGGGSGANNPGPVDGGRGSGSTDGDGEGDHDAASDPDRAHVFDPVSGDRGTEQRVDFDANDPSGETLGRTQGTGIDNAPTLPYSDRYTEYRDQAITSLDRMAVPPHMQDIVRTYFTELDS